MSSIINSEPSVGDPQSVSKLHRTCSRGYASFTTRCEWYESNFAFFSRLLWQRDISPYCSRFSGPDRRPYRHWWWRRVVCRLLWNFNRPIFMQNTTTLNRTFRGGNSPSTPVCSSWAGWDGKQWRKTFKWFVGTLLFSLIKLRSLRCLFPSSSSLPLVWLNIGAKSQDCHLVWIDRADELHGKHTLFGRCVGDTFFSMFYDREDADAYLFHILFRCFQNRAAR